MEGKDLSNEDWAPWDVFCAGSDKPLILRTGPMDGPNWDEDLGAGDYPNSWYFYLPRLCMHCENPPCATACLTGALTVDDRGLVLLDQALCRTCSDHSCLGACPYEMLFWDAREQAASKCNACHVRLDGNVAPACVRMCPGRAIWFGEIDVPGPIRKLVVDYRIAVPLRGDWGTNPRVYYVPPIFPPAILEGSLQPGLKREDDAEIQRMFGDQGLSARMSLQYELDRVRSGGESEMLETLVARDWHDLLGGYIKDPDQLEGRF